jgi:hypothetical protein
LKSGFGVGGSARHAASSTASSGHVSILVPRVVFVADDESSGSSSRSAASPVELDPVTPLPNDAWSKGHGEGGPRRHARHCPTLYDSAGGRRLMEVAPTPAMATRGALSSTLWRRLGSALERSDRAPQAGRAASRAGGHGGWSTG